MKRLFGLVLVSSRLLLAAANATSGELTGTVTDAESGAPIEGATVTVASERGVDVATATTDAAGRYSVKGVNAGLFLVHATARAHQRRYFGGDWVQGKTVSVVGGEAAAADIALSPGAELSGTVWRPDGTPLYPGYVWLIWRGGEPLRYFSTPTRPDGTYSSDDLPPGLYSARALTYDPVARQLVAPDWDFPDPVTLTVGVPLRLDVRLEGEKPEANWVGLVTGEKGQPLAGVQLMILRVVRRDGQEATEHVSVRRTDAQGRCELDELPPGRYRVSTLDIPPPYAPWRNPDPAARGADEYARHFEIKPDAQALTEMRLVRGRTLRVSLQDSSGSAALEDGGVSLELWHRGAQAFGGEGFSSRPERVGKGALEVRGLLPGATYELRLADCDDRARWCVAAVRGAPDRTIVVPLAEDPAPLEIRLRRNPAR
jgi:5-hydroxyisourate hydrolase-like protein (transthyretin family)